MKEMKVYVAGKVSKNSSFGTHHWRDNFCTQLSELSGIKLNNLDPLKDESVTQNISEIFKKDIRLINRSDVFVVYLSDDISVGGAQEILFAKYLKRKVLALAPYGGKFNNATREMFGKIITDYKDPFVFATCDKVCGTLEELADAIKNLDTIKYTSLETLLSKSLK
jgi:hypothetical protein